MSDNPDNDQVDTLDEETEDQIRARMRALAHDVAERADTDAALERMSRRSGPSTARLLAIAACLLAVVALAVALAADPETVGTTDQPPTTDCLTTEGALAPTLTPGGEMKTRIAAPVATAATAIMLIGACSDDGPTLIARGDDVEMVGEAGIAEATLNLDAQEEDGEVTGEFRVGDYVHTVQCADTSTDGLVILGGEVTASPDGEIALGALDALIIREGDPDSVAIIGNESGEASCAALLESIPEDFLDDDSNFHDVQNGSDIETG
jgi:hypothetical protein